MILVFQLPDPLRNAYVPSSDILVPDYICTSLLDRIIFQQAWKKKIEEAGAEFHAKVKKGTHYSIVV